MHVWDFASRQADYEAGLCRVLIVQDNPDIASMLALAVRRGGHDVETTRNGTEAIVVAGSYKPHMMLVDIGFPGVDGLYVVRQIRNTDSELLIIAATGRSGPEDIRRSREAGCDHHLVKPIDLMHWRRFLPSGNHEVAASLHSSITSRAKEPTELELLKSGKVLS